MLRIAGIIAVLVAATPGSARAEASSAPRTPPGTWSAAGYQQLRFGMGPGDVEDALRKGEGPLYLDKPLEMETPMPGLSVAAPGYGRVSVAGRSATAVVLAFWQDRLYLVALVFTGSDTDPGSPEWFGEASRLLAVKYGASAPCWRMVTLAVLAGTSKVLVWPTATLPSSRTWVAGSALDWGVGGVQVLTR
jgi:hypothetical protein